MRNDGSESESPRLAPRPSPAPSEARPGFPPFFRYLFPGVSLLAVFLVVLAALGSDHLPRSGEGEDDLAGSLSPDFVVRSELPVEVNDRIDRWVERFLGADRATIEMFLEREGLYGEMIRRQLEERGLPLELLYIPMIESALEHSAVSEASATGIWQFMEPTAEAYGLVVDSVIDERRDPVRATTAALDYLEDLHEMFGSWPLAVAAYNAGPETIRRALAASGGAGGAWPEDLFWKIRDQLPEKNREYLPKLLAVALISKNAEHFGLVGLEPLEELAYEDVFVPGGTSLSVLATTLDLPIDQLRELNPHLLMGVAPAGPAHLLRVPRGEADEVNLALGPEPGSAQGN